MNYIIEIDTSGEIIEHIFPDNVDIQTSIHSLLSISVNFIHSIFQHFSMVILDEFSIELPYNPLASILSKARIYGNVLLVSSVYSHGFVDDVTFLTPCMARGVRTACMATKEIYIKEERCI